MSGGAGDARRPPPASSGSGCVAGRGDPPRRHHLPRAQGAGRSRSRLSAGWPLVPPFGPMPGFIRSVDLRRRDVSNRCRRRAMILVPVAGAASWRGSRWPARTSSGHQVSSGSSRRERPGCPPRSGRNSAVTLPTVEVGCADGLLPSTAGRPDLLRRPVTSVPRRRRPDDAIRRGRAPPAARRAPLAGMERRGRAGGALDRGGAPLRPATVLVFERRQRRARATARTGDRRP